MWNLVSSKDQSKVKMAEAFYNTNKPITIKKLSQLTDSSSRSVKNYLRELKETIEEIGGEYVSSSEGVNFMIPINVGIDYFQKQIFKKSLSFSLLEKIFFDETLTREQLEKDLFISASTLNRITSTIREALRPYGLSLETNPFRVTGEESLIRNFYTQYFVEAYTVNEWPFKTLNKEIVDDLLPSATKYYESTSEIMSYTAFRFQFTVSMIRELNGYPNNYDNISKNECLSILYNKLVAEIEDKSADLMINSKENKNIYINELAKTRLFNSKNVLYDRLENDTSLNNRLSEIKGIITRLTEDFELPKEDQTHLVMEIDKGISFYNYYSKDVQPKQFLLYPPRDYLLINLYKRKYSMFYKLTEYYMRLLCNNRGFNPTEETLEYLVYLLISNWNNLTKNLFNRYNTTVIKVYSPISLRHAEGIAESLISDLPQSVEVSVLEEAIVDEEIISEHDFDLLISTETLMLDIEQPVIYMYKSRDSYQYDYLLKTIKEIALEKEEQAGERFLKNINP